MNEYMNDRLFIEICVGAIFKYNAYKDIYSGNSLNACIHMRIMNKTSLESLMLTWLDRACCRSM